MRFRTKITRTPCRRRTGEASTPRAEKFGDLMTADHKILNEECESRNNHRYAVVVQDLATQWIHSYPCKIKTSQETEKSLRKFLEPSQKPKVIHTDNSFKFGTCCEDLSWNHRNSTPHQSETNGIAERAVRRMNELATDRDLAVTTISLGGSRKESFHCPCRGTLLHMFLSEPVQPCAPTTTLT